MQNTNELSRTPTPEPPGPPERPSRGGFGTIAIILLVVAPILVLGAGLLAGWEFGRNNATSLTPGTSSQATTSQDAAVIATAQEFQPSVVQINVTTEKGSGLGTGTIIDSRGYIVTNYHVAEGAKSIMVELYDGTQFPAQLTGVDPFDVWQWYRSPRPLIWTWRRLESRMR